MMEAALCEDEPPGVPGLLKNAPDAVKF